jgi:hypothetical protein
MSNSGAKIETEETNDNDNDNESSTCIYNKISPDHYDILFKLREENNYLMIRMRDYESLKLENTYIKGKLDELENDNLILKDENG